jgi:hypothetical protein
LLLLPHTTGNTRFDLRLAFEEALASAPIVTIDAISPASPNLRVICGPSAHRSYDLSENSIDQRFSAVGTALTLEPSSAINATVREKLTKCGDFLQAADDQLRKPATSKGRTTTSK